MAVEVQQRPLGLRLWRRWWSVARQSDRLGIESIVRIYGGITGGRIVHVRLPITHLKIEEQYAENGMGNTGDGQKCLERPESSVRAGGNDRIGAISGM